MIYINLMCDECEKTLTRLEPNFRNTPDVRAMAIENDWSVSDQNHYCPECAEKRKQANRRCGNCKFKDRLDGKIICTHHKEIKENYGGVTIYKGTQVNVIDICEMWEADEKNN